MYQPAKGGQGELCDRARAGDHTIVLDTVRDSEYQLSLIGDDIDVYMTPPDKLPAGPGDAARVQALAARQGRKLHLFDG
jgi:hypothetical protein